MSCIGSPPNKYGPHDFSTWKGSAVVGPPLIFESMVFANEYSFSEIDMRRYSTEAEAKIGHEELVKKWTNS